MKNFLILIFIFVFSLSGIAKDKIIKEEIAPDDEDKKKLEDVSAKETTYPNLKNIKKELKNLPGFKKRFIPVPIAYTDPNVGLTIGGGLAGIFYDSEDTVRHLFVPYFQYNDKSKNGFTGRYLFFPTEKERFYYKISKSEEIDDELLMEYINQKFYLDKLSVSLLVDLWDSGTDRFYGVGYDSKEEDETNYTHREHLFEANMSYSVFDKVELGLKMDYRYFEVREGLLDDTPQTVDVVEDKSLIDKDILLSAKLRLLFTTDFKLFNKEMKLISSIWFMSGVLVYGDTREVTNIGLDLKFQSEIFKKLDFVGMISYEETHGKDLPFYVLPELGGSRSLRGYLRGRFYGHLLTRGMSELRWQAFEFNRLGLKTKWELAGFLDWGMVAENRDEFQPYRFNFAGGIGIRTRFSKGVLTRVDVGMGEEGVKVYVDFGYPF